jgi:hypothetical protein
MVMKLKNQRPRPMGAVKPVLAYTVAMKVKTFCKYWGRDFGSDFHFRFDYMLKINFLIWVLFLLYSN